MDNAVDLGARTGGLIPFWLFILVALLWAAAILVTARASLPRWPEMPRALAASGVLVLANALFFWRPLFTGAHVPRGGGDLSSFFFTLHTYSAERITSFELPIWNPTLHGGMPHLGNFQAGALYPPNLISYLIAYPFSYGALELLAILHYLIASAGAYLLMRVLGANRIGAVAGGLIFAYSGFMVAHLGHYSMIAAAAWLPWLLWAIERLVRDRSWSGAALLGVIVFLTATGGHQQTLLFACVGAGLWWLFRTGLELGVRVPGLGRDTHSEPAASVWATVWSRSGAVRLIQFGAAFGAGLAMAAPMILPSLQLARRSVRSALSFEQASEFSVQPVALLQLVLPTVFGSNPTDHWGAFSSGEIWGYAGVVTLALAVLGVALRRSPQRLFFALLAVLALIFALGAWAPLHGWFYKFVPLFDLVRAPARAYMFLDLSLAVLAGLAISDLSRAVPHTGVAWQRALAGMVRGLVVVVGAVGLIALPIFYAQVLGVDDPPNRPVITLDNLWLLFLFLTLLLGVIWLARDRLLRGSLLGVALVVIVVLDLFSATMPFNPVDEDLVASYRAPEVAGFLQQQRSQAGPFRVDVQHPGLYPNFGATEGIHNASGVFDPMQPRAYTELHNVLAEDVSLPAYDMLNVRYRIQAPETETPAGFAEAFTSGTGTRVLERESALPRTWFVADAIEVGPGAALDAVRDEAFDPAETVVVEEPPVALDGSAGGTVSISSYEPERISIEVDVDGAGYLVIADGYYPGWSATVDGEPATIHRANHGLRAVPVDESTNRVQLRYEPAIVTAGFAIAGAGAVLLGGMVVLGIVRRNDTGSIADR